jgi:hypothetical protein
MTEKSMICAYMCILFDGQPSLGEKYLEVALNHAQELKKLLTPMISSSKNQVEASTMLVQSS